MTTGQRSFRTAIRIALLFLYAVLSACSRAEPILEHIGTLEVTRGIQSMAWHPDGKRLAVGYFGLDEVEVWDVEQKKPLFKVPSKRRPINQSGQEVAFSPDGKYLIVQDFLDTKNGEPKFPRSLDDPLELPARADLERYVLARVWSLRLGREVAQLRGPGSVMHGGVQDGVCWLPKPVDAIAIHRGAYIAVYDASWAGMPKELDLSHPFPEQPTIHKGYWKMACHPNLPLVAMEGAQFFANAPLFGFPARSGATPIVVANVETGKIIKVLYTPTPLNGVIWTANGTKLVSFGAPPIRVWDATKDFASVGEIADPNANSGAFTSLPGFDGVLGVSTDLTIWDTSGLKKIAVIEASPRDVFRVATHAPSSVIAVAAGRNVFLYKFHAKRAQAALKGE